MLTLPPRDGRTRESESMSKRDDLIAIYAGDLKTSAG
jgi:hypothetical protein